METGEYVSAFLLFVGFAILIAGSILYHTVQDIPSKRKLLFSEVSS